MNLNKKTIVNQWGSSSIPFSEYSQAEIACFVFELVKFIKQCKQVTGYEIFATYGTLLGAIREQNAISQDFDFDVCLIIPNIDNKEDLVEAFAHAIKKIRQLDSVVDVNVSSATQYAVSYIAFGIRFTIDFFLGWFERDIFYQAFSIDHRFGISESDIFPLAQLKFASSELPGPKNYHKFLYAIYGESWGTRDDNFSYMTYFSKLGGLPPPENTVFGRISFNKKYWDDYYAKHDSIAAPSQFAVFAESWGDTQANVIEVGAGSGRDSLYFLARGHSVTITDYSSGALSLISNALTDNSRAHLKQLDYADTLNMEDFSRTNANQFDIFYSRFLFHAVSEVAELNLLNVANEILKNGGLLMAEFRVYGDGIFDKHKPWDELELTSDHYRRPLVTNDFVDKLINKGFEIVYQAEGRGFAFHKSEDPLVARVVAKKTNK